MEQETNVCPSAEPYNDVLVIQSIYEDVKQKTHAPIKRIWMDSTWTEYHLSAQTLEFKPKKVHGGCMIAENWQRVARHLYRLHTEFPGSTVKLTVETETHLHDMLLNVSVLFNNVTALQ